MDIDMVKSRDTRNTLRLTNWRRSARRSSSKKSMSDSYEIQNSVIEWLKVIQTKNIVDNGMFLRMKIILTIWLRKNVSTTRANDDFIQTSKIPLHCHWGIDLISSRHCQPCIDCNEKQMKTHKCPLTLTQVNNGRHGVLLQHEGIDKICGGLLEN